MAGATEADCTICFERFKAGGLSLRVHASFEPRFREYVALTNADGDGRPRILPLCGHSFCTGCLTGLFASQSYRNCPTCRKPIGSMRSVESLAVNWSLLSLLGHAEENASRSEAIEAKAAEEKVKASEALAQAQQMMAQAQQMMAQAQLQAQAAAAARAEAVAGKAEAEALKALTISSAPAVPRTSAPQGPPAQPQAPRQVWKTMALLRGVCLHSSLHA